MLDLNHPQTNNIFKSSGYIDRIKFGCQTYINQTYEERQLTFDKMKIECDKMLTFSKNVFPKQFNDIENSLKKIEIEISNLRLINQESEPGKCKVCNGEIKSFKSYVKEFPKITICQKCPKSIYNFLLELEGLTGAMWI
ncbi:hypothetical protein F0358_13235 [Empedobacter brevis]|uniref:hypothetical protein n=1 Tax=Empedobacter brevis TaxID=247 RepID=UPI00123E2223|nr:hypothetical protein [Empedobacter brevis]QES93614.1 hypothetical protein F0358_13235 [Empedobacter brevis]